MKSRFLCLTLLLLLIFTLSPTSTVLADTGPKPSMGFTFTGEPVTIVSGILYECDQPDCSDATPLEELGPQGFYCDAESCSATAYGFAPHHKIEVEFSDGITRQSNVFETAGFISEYTVTVRPADLLVEAQFNLSTNPRTSLLLIVCGCLMIAGLMIIAGVVFLLRRRAAR